MSNGIGPTRFTDTIQPWFNAVDEAIRTIVCCGLETAKIISKLAERALEIIARGSWSDRHLVDQHESLSIYKSSKANKAGKIMTSITKS